MLVDNRACQLRNRQPPTNRPFSSLPSSPEISRAFAPLPSPSRDHWGLDNTRPQQSLRWSSLPGATAQKMTSSDVWKTVAFMCGRDSSSQLCLQGGESFCNLGDGGLVWMKQRSGPAEVQQVVVAEGWSGRCAYKEKKKGMVKKLILLYAVYPHACLQLVQGSPKAFATSQGATWKQVG